MVKGNSKQVIVVSNPDQRLFDQAIFILKDEAVGQGITDELLLKEANRALRSCGSSAGKGRLWSRGPIWAAAGALVTGSLWLLSILI